MRHRNRINIFPSTISVSQSLIYHRQDRLQVTSRRYLWYHSAILRKDIYLAHHHVRQNPHPVLHHSHRRLIAARLNS